MRWFRQQGGSLIDGGAGVSTLFENRLPWAPAAAGIDLSSASTVTIPSGQNFVNSSTFNGNNHWILNLGAQPQQMTVDCGGKYVFASAFSVNITFDPTTNYAQAITGRRAILFQNFAGLHLEGFRLYGTTISDGLNLSTTVAGAIAQVQNFSIEGLRENYYDTGSAAALITASDGSQPQYNHPDVIQSYGGPAVLRVSHGYAESDRSFSTLATGGPPVGPNLTSVFYNKIHYKQLRHPLLGDQQTYPVYWNQAAGEPNTFPWTLRNFYYEHGNAARNAANAFFPNGDTRWAANVAAGNIIEAAPAAEFINGNPGPSYRSPGYGG